MVNIDIKYEQPILNGIGMAGDLLGTSLFGDSELGRGLGSLFSSVGSGVALNVFKGLTLTSGLSQNAFTSLGGTAAGLASYGIGQGINALGGDTALSRGLGAGISTGLGTLGGLMIHNLQSPGKNLLTTTFTNAVGDEVTKKGFFGMFLTGGANGKNPLKSLSGTINPYAFGASVIGSALGAALGPSKEYGGRHGSITLTADTIYDTASGLVNFIPGVGQGISGIMALNKGLSNLFGSTDGMTVQDAILGSAFMPFPIKWINMIGAKTTDTFNNLSWLNSEKANTFMGNAFGNLNNKFDTAKEEAGKTYGTFSQGAYRDALRNISFANNAWNRVLAMADLNELQNIRSLAMSSINNQRYALNILGGWSPLARGKYGMKILNNATNHNIGMRLLSGAALIDNKQMILCSAVD